MDLTLHEMARILTYGLSLVWTLANLCIQTQTMQVKEFLNKIFLMAHLSINLKTIKNIK